MTSERDFFFRNSTGSSHPFLHSESADSASGVPAPFATHIMMQQVATGDSLVEPKVEKKKPRGTALVFETLTVLVLGVLLALGLHVFVTQVYAISGQSMEPTLHNGERVVIHKLSPSIVGLEQGDMVIFTSPDDDKKNLIKRVIAVAGDEIEINRDVVFVNGESLDEDYTRRGLDRISSEVSPRKVPAGHIYVLGDNRPASQDSRHFGFVPVASIKGKVFLRLWPLDTISTFD